MTSMAAARTRLCVAASLAAGATAAWPPAVRGQQPDRVPRVGWIWNGPSAGNPAEAAGFRQALSELGYIEGQNIVVDYRFGEGRDDRLADLAAELVQLGPSQAPEPQSSANRGASGRRRGPY